MAALAGEIVTVHPVARAFVDLLLDHYIKCDTIEELRSHRTAITRECFVRRNYTDSHLNPHIYGRWFIGERAAPRQIESRQKHLDEIAAEMATLQQRDGALRERIALTSEKIRPLIDLEHTLESLTALAERETLCASLSAELSGLDLRAAETLHTEVEKQQAVYSRLQAEVGALERKMGGLEAEARSLADNDIPRLEIVIDQSIQTVEAFLAAVLLARSEQTDEDFRAEIEKEYTRRLERQPVEVIQQNAERYEGDYQNAESRNRDRLREAKQAYSMRYDFGYDDEEHAARYSAECKKLIESELPQYEA
jgi:hypothetical protein